MCLATVYVEKNGQREEVMHDVAWIKPESGGLQLMNFIGESRFFEAEIKSIDLMNNSIVIERVSTDSRPMMSDDQQE